MMKIKNLLQKISNSEDLNFLLTNRIPRITLTHFMGWLSQIEHPWVSKICIQIWKLFADLDLTEAKEQTFKSLHACFIRELKPGARTVDLRPNVISSPCDGIIGEFGDIRDGQLFQAKGFPYTLSDLLGDEPSAHQWKDGKYITIRITSSMYHRFHAPFSGEVKRLKYFSGDTWNVNPIALKRIEKLFCKNERALLEYKIHTNASDQSDSNTEFTIGIIPVAAVLVASIKLHGIDPILSTRYKGPTEINCSLPFTKGQEMGWFQHGSTILMFAPKGFIIENNLFVGENIKMGQALMMTP
jgi:phosphatidylserine decarboxylase